MSYKSWYEISLSEFLAWHSLSYIVHLSIIQIFIACIILIKLGGKVLIFLEFTVTFPVYVFLNRFSFSLLLLVHMMWVFTAILLEGDFSLLTEINSLVRTQMFLMSLERVRNLSSSASLRQCPK